MGLAFWIISRIILGISLLEAIEKGPAEQMDPFDQLCAHHCNRPKESDIQLQVKTNQLEKYYLCPVSQTCHRPNDIIHRSLLATYPDFNDF